MKLLVSSLIIFMSVALFFSCSEVNNDITPAPEVSVHALGFGDPSSPNFHKYFFGDNDWNYNTLDCQGCHGSNYEGGVTGYSCKTCHTQDAGPDACNTCHGDFADPTRISPPKDLSFNIDNSAVGVGAHTNHVYENMLSQNIGCFECHEETISDENFVYAHTGPPPAKMGFGEFSYPDSSFGDPTYDFNNHTCSNVYCHGAFDYSGKVGNNVTVTFNLVDGSQAFCGSCHGQEIDGQITPLPVGHFGTFMKESCVLCHPSVVNAEGEIIDKSKHINKEVDL